MLAWPFHILLDFPFHSKEYFPTKLLYPLTDFSFDGIPWSNPEIWFPNISGIIILFIYRAKFDPRKQTSATLPSNMKFALGKPAAVDNLIIKRRIDILRSHNGFFDNTIIEILQNYEKILEIILPTLRKERKSTYSPFLPISKKTGNVLQIKIDEYRTKDNSIIYTEPLNNKKVEVLVKGKGKKKDQYRGTTKWMQVVNFISQDPVNSLEMVNLKKVSNNSILGEV